MLVSGGVGQTFPDVSVEGESLRGWLDDEDPSRPPEAGLVATSLPPANRKIKTNPIKGRLSGMRKGNFRTNLCFSFQADSKLQNSFEKIEKIVKNPKFQGVFCDLRANIVLNKSIVLRLLGLGLHL